MHFAISDLEVGMEVDQEVSDASGRILAGVGVLLTDRHLEVFLAWGIASVSIRAEGEQVQKQRVLSKEEERALRERFTHLDLEQPFGRALFAKCLDRERAKPAPIGECE